MEGWVLNNVFIKVNKDAFESERRKVIGRITKHPYTTKTCMEHV